nr:hypothetical protein [Paenibacillus sinopodophylli]
MKKIGETLSRLIDEPVTFQGDKEPFFVINSIGVRSLPFDKQDIPSVATVAWFQYDALILKKQLQ